MNLLPPFYNCIYILLLGEQGPAAAPGKMGPPGQKGQLQTNFAVRADNFKLYEFMCFYCMSCLLLYAIVDE